MGRLVLFTNLLCAKSAQIKRVIEQHGVRVTEVPLTGQPFAEQIPRVTGRKSLPLLALNRKEYLTAEDILELDSTGTLEKKLKDAVEDATDPKGLDEDVKELSFDDKLDDDKLEEMYYRVRDPSEGVKIRVPTMKKDKYFKATDLVSWAIKSASLAEADAVRFGQQLKDKGYISKRHDENLKASATAFANDTTSWRFAEDIDSLALNVRRTVEKTSDISSPVAFSAELISRLLLILQKHGTDYHALTKVAAFRKFLSLTTHLQITSLSNLSDQETTCFFLNVYNTLLLHSALVGGSSKKTLLARYYNIGGMKFSLVDIEVGIFRGNRKPVGDGKVFERKDERASLVPSWADPRTLFIVYPSGKSSCPIQVFTTDTLEEGLFRAAELVCEEIELDVDKKTVTLPPMFQQYGFDFGKGKLEILQWVDKYLPEEKSVMLGLIIRNPPAEISLQYFTYPWESISRFALVIGEPTAARVPNEEVEEDEPPPAPVTTSVTPPPSLTREAAKRAEEQNARIMRGGSGNVAASPKPISRQASDSAAALAQSFSELSSAAMNNPGRPRFYWEVDMEEVEMGPKIGQGAFGVVYKAEWAGTEVAVKQLLGDDFTDQQLNEFLKEINIMSQLRHPNIVLFVGACLQPPNVFYLTEFLPRGSLHACLSKEAPLDWRLRVHMATDGAKGMTYLHMRNMLHRDIKSLNFLVDINYVTKVADFGLSKVLQDNTKAMMNTRVGTLNWLAPETLADHGVYTTKSDVFSYGMVLFEILTHRAPFEGKNPLQVIRALDAGDRPDLPADADPVFVQLVKEAWHQDPSKRPTFADMLKRLRAHLHTLDAAAAQATVRVSGTLAVAKPDLPRKLSNA